MKQKYIKFAVLFYNYYFFYLCGLRGRLYSLFLKKKGKRFEVCKGVTIMSPQNVEVGDDVYIGRNVTIAGQCGVVLGNNIIINHNVNIISVNHVYQNAKQTIREQGYRGGQITIGDDVWVGTGAVILDGVTIHKGAVVGANAVVTKDVSAYTVVGGVPAHIIAKRTAKKTP